MTTEQKKFWIGMGIGFAAGGIVCGTTCYCVSRRSERRKADERVRKERDIAYLDGEKIGYSKGYTTAIDDSLKGGEEALKEAYKRGVDDAVEESQKWIGEHVIQLDSDDPKEIQKAIEQYQNNQNGSNTEAEDKKLTEEDYAVKETAVSDNEVEQIFEHSRSKMDLSTFSGRKYMIQHVKSGTTLEYPIELVSGVNGFLSPLEMRENFREYEKDPNKLRMIWQAMGWGEYYPDEEIPSIETINNWNVSLDDVNKMLEEAKDIPEPEEQTIERERYLDRVEAYKNHPEIGIKYITYDEYSEESHLDPIRLDYYAGDNVFLQPDSDDRKLEDPVTDLGVSNGNILFEENPYKDRDPDTVYLENFGQHFVAEITRYKGNSTGIMDGSAYLNGETGVVGGTARV